MQSAGSRALLALMLLTMSAPAFADVKAGVDAWERGDYPAAVAAWRPLALSGDADAQFNLAQAYKLGRGVPADLVAAEDWYRKAALKGHVQAEDNYGLVLFQNGKRAEAMPWIRKSADRGEPRAQYVLGTALFNGDLADKDWVRAYALMTRASSRGITQASASLAQMDRYIPADQRQRGLAMARDIETAAARPAPPPVAPGPARIAMAPDRPPQPAAGREPIHSVDVPASRPGTSYPAPGEKPAPVAKPAPVSAKPGPAPVKPAPTAVAKPTPTAVAKAAPPPASGKGWRVQLGAFSDEAKAKTLWSGLSAKPPFAGLQPYLVKAGSFTRLQAGPLANKAAAERLCGAAKSAGAPCFPVAP